MEYSARLVMIGDPETGKTSLLTRYSDEEWTGTTKPTVCAAMRKLTKRIGGRDVDLTVWDTAGQETYRAIGPIYYRRAQGAICVFDLTKMETFRNLESWITAFRENVEDGIVVVAANKADLDDSIEVSADIFIKWGEKNGIFVLQTSAITGTGVDELFEKAIKTILKIPNAVQETQDQVQIDPQPNQTSKSCC